MGLWNRLFGGGDEEADSTNDYDENGKFTPGPAFYNVSQEAVPIKKIADDSNSTYWETPKGNLIKTRPVDNEGDA